MSVAAAAYTDIAIRTARVFQPLMAPARYKGAYGGRGSGKSHAFAALLIERCLLGPTRAVCVREVQRSLEQSVKRLLEDKIQQFGLGAIFRVLDTHIETPGGGIVIFQGMQNHTAESIKSLEGYDVAWVEEAQALSQRSLDLLRPTIRTPGSELWFSWNPNQPTDPVDDFFRGQAPRAPTDPPWQAPPDAVLVHANYSDNPWFPVELRRDMAWDQARDPEKYAHVWRGAYRRNAEARVFRNWTVRAFETPAGAEFLFGADWGFASDPSVLVRAFVEGRTLYVDAEAYAVGCEIDHTPALFDTIGRGMARQWRVIADSARPETISYMQKHGYPKIRPARKGAGSVEEGVEFLKSYDVVVHPRCIHAIEELTTYAYKTHPLTGDVLPVLEDKKNHVIDALRYAVEALRFRAKGGAAAMTIAGF